MKKLITLMMAMTMIFVAGFATPIQEKPDEKVLVFKFSKQQVDAINIVLQQTTAEYVLGAKAIDLAKSWTALFSKEKTEIEVKVPESDANALFASIDNNNGNHNLCKALGQLLLAQAQAQLQPPQKK